MAKLILQQMSPVCCRNIMPREHAQKSLADAEADVADGFAAEALFQFSQDFGLRNLLEFVVQCGLEDADVEDSAAQRHGCRVRGDEVADDL